VALKKLIIVIAVVLAAAAGVYLAGTYSLDTGDEAGPVRTERVRRGDLRIEVSATGSITPDTVVIIKSKAGGEIISLPFEEGDRIEKGAVVVRLDPATEKTRVRQAEANLLMAEARLEKTRVAEKDAEIKLERQQSLFADEIISAQELDDAVITEKLAASDVRIAEAEVIQSKEKLKEAREFLDDTVLRAPLTGTVLKRFVDEGQIISSTLSSVSEGTELFSMANLDKLFVTAQVDEVDISRVLPGQEARVSVDSLPGTVFKARVIRVAPLGKVERTVTVFDVFIEVTDDGRGRLKPGMTADIGILTDLKKDALLVPNSALRVRDGRVGVYVAGDPAPLWTPLETGATDGIITVVTKGVNEGEELVLSAPAADNRRAGSGRGLLRVFRRRK
jgi:HlyD family secretion protein